MNGFEKPTRNLLQPFFYFGNNPTTLIGSGLTTASAITLIFYWIANLSTGTFQNPYLGLIFFLGLPGLFVLGLLLVPLGMWQRRRALVSAGLTSSASKNGSAIGIPTADFEELTGDSPLPPCSRGFHQLCGTALHRIGSRGMAAQHEDEFWIGPALLIHSEDAAPRLFCDIVNCSTPEPRHCAMVPSANHQKIGTPRNKIVHDRVYFISFNNDTLGPDACFTGSFDRSLLQGTVKVISFFKQLLPCSRDLGVHESCVYG